MLDTHLLEGRADPGGREAGLRGLLDPSHVLGGGAGEVRASAPHADGKLIESIAHATRHLEDVEVRKLTDLLGSNVSHRILVFDSNRRPEDAAFLDELMEPQKKDPNYTFVGTMTEMEKSSREWHGETGYITKAMLLKHTGDLTLPIYYIDGPPAMVTAMRETLGKAGVDDDNIRTEEFSGYSEAE
jgi:hypothetical protein